MSENCKSLVLQDKSLKCNIEIFLSPAKISCIYLVTNFIETTTSVTQSITSPVTSISTEPGNSNDSQPMPMENNMPPTNMMNNFVPTPHVAPVMMEEPMEKKRKTVIIISIVYPLRYFELFG